MEKQSNNRRHAFLIIAHNQFELLKVLIQQIDHEYHDIFIHIDKRAKGYDINELVACAEHSKIYILNNRIAVRWGTYDQIECEMMLMKVAASTDNYAYYHLLSGQDLLIKPSDVIYSYFEKNYGVEYVQYIDHTLPESYILRVNKYHLFVDKHPSVIKSVLHKLALMVQFGINRSIPEISEYQKGANWCTITDNLVSYLIKHENIIRKAFKYTLCGDEFFVQTMLINSQLKSNIVHENFCDNYKNIMYEIDWNRGTPYEYNIDDFDMLKSSDMFFARKFNWEKDSKIVIAIRDRITNVKSKK